MSGFDFFCLGFVCGMAVAAVFAVWCFREGRRVRLFREQPLHDWFNKHTFYSGEAGPTEPPMTTEKTDD